jgi:hypothetical protein
VALMRVAAIRSGPASTITGEGAGCPVRPTGPAEFVVATAGFLDGFCCCLTVATAGLLSYYSLLECLVHTTPYTYSTDLHSLPFGNGILTNTCARMHLDS